MSLLNLDWIVENFNKESFTFFEIGLAGIQQSMSFELKKRIPKGKYYTFEAAEYWHDLNEQISLKHEINYYKYAVCDIDGEVLFYPSLTQNEQAHTLSSSIFELYKGPYCNSFDKEYGKVVRYKLNLVTQIKGAPFYGKKSQSKLKLYPNPKN